MTCAPANSKHPSSSFLLTPRKVSELHRQNTALTQEIQTLEQAVACHESPEYQAASAHRKNGGGEVELTILEAGEFTR